MTSLKQQLQEAKRNLGYCDFPHVEKSDAILQSILADMSRPFDPTECGFKQTNRLILAGGLETWEQIGQEPDDDPAEFHRSVRIEVDSDLVQHRSEFIDLDYGYSRYTGPWPASHFDGVRLLLSLGVIKEGEG